MEGYIRTEEAAAYLSLSPATLARMRMKGDGPPFSKAGPRIVVYRIQDLEAWLASRSRTSTRS